MSERASPGRPGGRENEAWHTGRRSPHAERALEGGPPPMLDGFARERAAQGVADSKTGPFGTATGREG